MDLTDLFTHYMHDAKAVSLLRKWLKNLKLLQIEISATEKNGIHVFKYIADS